MIGLPLQPPLAVIPVLIGPTQVLLAILPGVLMALGGVLLSLLKPSVMRNGLKLLWRLKLPVALAIAAVVAVAYAGSSRRAGGRAGATEPAAGEWTLFRGGAARRGAALDGKSPTAPAANWRFAPAREGFYSSPTVRGNRIYVTSANYGVFADSGAIYGLDADTGATVWEARPKGYRATYSSPSLSADGRYLVCGEGLHFTREARVFCFDLARAEAEGAPRLRWSHATGSHVESSPCIADGRVYIGAGDDGYYALALEGDGHGGSAVLWHAAGSAYPDAESSPLALNGRVYVGLGLGGNAVCCLDALTGREIWRLATPHPVFAPPTVVQGAAGTRVFVGMGVGDMVNTPEEFAAKEIRKRREAGARPDELARAEARLAPAGEVWCIDADRGTKVWSVRVGQVVLGAVAAADDRLYFASRDGIVHGLAQADGASLAVFDAKEPILASPACTETHVYVITAAGRLHGLERASLRPAWSMTVGGVGRYVSSPAVARGRLYVGTEQDGLVCAGTASSAAAAEPWAGAAGSLPTEGALLPGSGAMLWSYPPRSRAPAISGAGAEADPVVAPPAVCRSRLYVPLAAGSRKGLACLDAESAGGVRPPPEQWFFATTNGVRIAPAARSDLVLVADGAPGDDARGLHAVDPQSGREAWRHALDRSASGRFAPFAGSVYVEDGERRLTRLALDGATLWSTEPGPLSGAPDESEAIAVIATRAPAAAWALDRGTGAVLWRADLPSAPVTGPTVRARALVIGTGSGVDALRLVDGQRLWHADAAPRTPLAFGGGRIVYVGEGGRLVVLDETSGARRDAAAGACADVAPQVVSGGILYATEGELAVLDDATAASRAWMETGWLGPLACPPIAAGPRVYLAVAKRGLVCAGERP